MMAFLLAILATPMAIATVTATGSPSGIADTAVATATINISDIFSPRQIPAPNTTAENPRTAIPMSLANLSSLSCIGVRAPSTSLTCSAIWPRTVVVPVSTTTPLPLPLTIIVPVKAIFLWSPGVRLGSFINEVIFSTGIDSPVSAASSALNSIVWNKRRSAGTFPPDAISTTSPGTSSSLAISFSLSFLTTLAFGRTIFLRAFKLSSALNSWTYPTIPLSITTAIITPLSMYSWSMIVTTAAMIRI